MSESQLPQGFPAEPPGFPVPLFATGRGALAPHYYADPLVTPPGLGFAGWWMRFTTTLRQLWASLLGVAALVAIPPFAWTLNRSPGVVTRIGAPGYQNAVGSMSGHSVVTVVLGLVCGGFGTAASVWIMVRRANARDAGFVRAFAHGVRRMLPIAGWQGLLYGVLMIIGVFAIAISQCLGVLGVLIGAVLFIAMIAGGSLVAALVGPIVALRAAESPIRMSMDLIRDNLGAALGRILLTYLIADGPAVVLNVVYASLILEVHSMPSPVSTLVSTTPVAALVAAVGMTWAATIRPVGMLLTYAELRARDRPMLSADLLDSMEPSSSGPADWDWSNRPPIPAARTVPVSPDTHVASPAVPPRPDADGGQPDSA